VDIDLLALPDDIAAVKEIVRGAMSRADAAEADSAAARAAQSDTAAYIEHLKLQIEKLRRALYGPRAERTARLLDQMELKLEELETAATEDELRAEQEAAKAKTTTVAGFTRKRPPRQPFPEHLPREWVVLPGPTQCFCCGGSLLAKLGESMTETLESTPRTFKVIQHVREKFTCRDCEKISQEPAPFHTIPRAFAGPSLLAMAASSLDGQRKCARISSNWHGNSCEMGSRSAPLPGPSTFTRRRFTASLRDRWPYAAFLFLSAAQAGYGLQSDQGA
jgi:hypothetical protein